MNDRIVEKSDKKKGRNQFLLVALVFGVPLLLATWMYNSGRLLPQSGSNAGNLLEPIVSLADILPSSPVITAAERKWLMLYADNASCATDCRTALHRMRQTRQMLGKEMSRLERVFLHGESAPDTVFLAQEHAGLITIVDADLGKFLEQKRPADEVSGGIYLIDPFGNLVMYFSPELLPRDMVDDIKHLLKLSRIG